MLCPECGEASESETKCGFQRQISHSTLLKCSPIHQVLAALLPCPVKNLLFENSPTLHLDKFLFFGFCSTQQGCMPCKDENGEGREFSKCRAHFVLLSDAYEYREGISVCPECLCGLIEPDEVNPDLPPRPDEKERRLCSAASDFEAEIIIAKLRAEGIYAFIKYRGSDSYNKILLGRTVLGVDIFVGESDYQAARDIVQNV